MSHADRIRIHGRERYVLPARERRQSRFSIRTGDVVQALQLNGRAPAVCSALKTHQFLKDNGLRLIETTGPKSGQSTTVTFTYEFIDDKSLAPHEGDPWPGLRGALKDLFAELGGGDAYLRAERSSFHAPEDRK
ncbi:MAG: hypothetical protein WCF26_17150 [Candidatus Sulfotelmatobacter sp.]